MLKKSTIILLGVFVTLSNVWASNLLEMVDNALDSNSEYKSYVREYESQLTNVAQAKSYLYPTLTLSASITRLRTNTDYSDDSPRVGKDKSNLLPYEYEIDFVQPIIVIDSWYQFSKADLYKAQAEAQLINKKNDLIARIITKYLDILQIQDSIDLLSIRKTLLKNQMDAIEKKVGVGVARSLDFSEIQVENSRLQHEEISLQNNLNIKLLQLEELVGASIIPNGKINLSSDNIPQLNQMENEWEKKALNNNLNLIILGISLELAKKDVNVARSSYFPKLTANLAFKDAYDPVKEVDNQKTLSAGLNFTMELFSGGRNVANTKKAKLNQEAILFNIDKTKKNVSTSISSLYTTLLDNINQLDSLTSNVDFAYHTYLATKVAYDNGSRSSLDVLVSIKNYYVELDNVLQSKYKILSTIVNMYQFTGELNQSVIKLIDYYL